MDKGKITISIIIFFITIVLVSLIFIQFRTVEETNTIGIESMREDELRQEVLGWKTKYNELSEKIQSNKQKIQEYSDTVQNNKETSQLLDEELLEYNMLAGKTDVVGEGVILKLSDNTELSFSASNLIYLINELKYAGAEAISINDQRIVNSTDIASINSNQYILVNGERIVEPYEVRAIGSKDELDKILNFKEEGFIPYYKNKGYTIEARFENNVEIKAYNKKMQIKYIEEKKEE